MNINRSQQIPGTLWKPALLALLVPILMYAYEFGPPAAHTGGFGEPTCTECHFVSGGIGVNQGQGSITVNAPSSYTSGTTYPIAVTVSDPAQRRWGFELSVRTQDGKQAGVLKPGADGFTQLAPLNNIQYIEHTTSGTRAGTLNGATFNFTWTAPDSSAGPLIFNAAGNAANNNNLQTGDHIYTAAVTVAPQAASSGPAPSVGDSGTVNAASFAPGTTPLAPGGMVTIFGTNLNDGSTATDSSFDSSGKLVTTLGGASVTFNGIPAPMIASFSTQISVQLPFELAGSTSAQVQVNTGGQTSPGTAVPIGTASPGIFTIPPGDQKPTAQGAIKISNTATFAAPTGSIAGADARPAKPGEFITIFCTGLGDVSNRPDTGKAAPGGPLASALTTPQVTIGGIPAVPTFSGLSPGFVSLYQIDVQVPAAAPSGNTVPIVVNLGGVAANTVNIAVAAP